MVNQNPWLGTVSGKVIDLIEPDPAQITIEDIATGLSKVARFNGQTTEWYSVAEHSIHVAELVPNDYKLEALLHDSAEAYLCDVPTPLKALLGDSYRAVERRLLSAIGEALGVSLTCLSAQVKQADAILLYSERDLLQPGAPDWGHGHDQLRFPNLKRVYSTPDNAKQAFVNYYRKLT